MSPLSVQFYSPEVGFTHLYNTHILIDTQLLSYRSRIGAREIVAKVSPQYWV